MILASGATILLQPQVPRSWGYSGYSSYFQRPPRHTRAYFFLLRAEAGPKPIEGRRKYLHFFLRTSASSVSHSRIECRGKSLHFFLPTRIFSHPRISRHFVCCAPGHNEAVPPALLRSDRAVRINASSSRLFRGAT